MDSRDGLPRGVLPSGILKIEKYCPGLKVRSPKIHLSHAFWGIAYYPGYNFCCSDHFLETGQIKVSDGSLQDCNKALHHYDKMLVEAKFLSRPGKFNETEFVKFWYNCHTIFNSYDLSKSCHLYKRPKICLYQDR